MKQRTCTVCSADISHRQAPAIYCGLKCKWTATNAKRHRRPQRTCPGCGLDLSNRNGQVKFCSAACRSWVRNGHDDLRARAVLCTWCLCAMPPGKPVSARFCSRVCKNASVQRRRVRDDRSRYIKERARRMEYATAYALANPHVGQAAKRKRKVLLTASGVYRVTGRDWERILNRCGSRCHYCGTKGPLTMDHVIPVSRGGVHSVGNLVAACAPCNSQKRHRTIMEWRLGRRVSLVA